MRVCQPKAFELRIHLGIDAKLVEAKPYARQTLADLALLNECPTYPVVSPCLDAVKTMLLCNRDHLREQVFAGAKFPTLATNNAPMTEDGREGVRVNSS